MKLTAFTSAVLSVLISQAGAFSLDFTGLGLVGTNVSLASPMTVNVAGYGDVRFSMPAGELGTVDINYSGGEESLEIDPSETIIVDFLGLPVEQVVFDFIGVSAGEGVSPNDVNPNQSTVSLIAFNGDADGAGLEEVRFVIIPEPSAALLGALGLLLFRRRR